MVVQPDVLVVLEHGQATITPSRILGAPDLVIEVVSPTTASYDQHEKRDAYARAGIPEYWLVDSGKQTVEILFLNDGVYQSQGIFSGEQQLTSRFIPTIREIKVATFFQ